MTMQQTLSDFENNQELRKDQNWLTEQYWGFNRNTVEIAKYFGLNPRNNAGRIARIMKKLDIPLEQDIIDFYHYPDWLVEKHYDDNLSIEKIGKLADVSGTCISDLMHGYGLPINMQIEHTCRNEEGKRWCYRCEQWLDEKEFHRNKNTTDGFHAKCKKCRKKDGLEHRENERIIALQIYSKGFMKCTLCEIDDIDILTIDHICGGGRKHAKENNIGGQFVRWLEQNNYPDGYRVLCWNCQHKERMNLLQEYSIMVKTWTAAKKRSQRATVYRDEYGKKYCPSCKRWLYEKKFGKNKTQLDGLKEICHDCKKEGSLHDSWVIRQCILQIYSNGFMKCTLCGCDDIDCLAIDHIDGGGRKHRKKVGHMYSWLKKNNYFDGFRILCHNCNHKETLRLQA